MITINDVIAMKKEKNVPFGTQFRWLIQTVENELVSKLSGKERVRKLLADYDYSAKLFIVHQFFHLDEENLANELFTILELDTEKNFLEDKYVNELVDENDL